MKKTHHTTEQIIRILREAETSGQSHAEICRQYNISSRRTTNCIVTQTQFVKLKSKNNSFFIWWWHMQTRWLWLNILPTARSFT